MLSGCGEDVDAADADLGVDVDARPNADHAITTDLAPTMDLALAAETSPRLLARADCVTDVTNRIRPEFGMTPDLFTLYVRHMGRAGSAELTGEVANAVTWNVSMYTGLTPPTPISAWQRGYYDLAPPSSSNAFQLSCRSAGSFINTWSFDHTEPVVGGGPNVVWAMRWGTQTNPFAHATSALRIEADLAVPWIATWKDAIGQLSFYVYLTDTVGGTTFAYVLQAFDSRPFGMGNGNEAIGFDTQVAFVSVPLIAGTKYASVVGAGRMHNAAFAAPERFAVQIDRQQLRAAIDDVNTHFPNAKLSTSPDDYALIEAGALHEVFVGTDATVQISMGARIDDLTVSETF